MVERIIEIGIIIGALFIMCLSVWAAEVEIVQDQLPAAQLVVTGKGYSPVQLKSSAKGRLLAQRAATVDAYRTLGATLNGVSGYLERGQGYLRTSGYVRGAQVVQIRHYPDGKAEVDLTLPINLKGRRARGRTTWERVINDISGRGCQVYYLEKPKVQITEEEWVEIVEKKGE